MEYDITDVYRPFDTSIVADAMDEHGIDGVVTDITPVTDDQFAVGRAHTMRFVEAETTGEETNFPYAMLNELVADRVIVIEGADPELSCWGGKACLLAQNAGVNGIVIDGGFRDVPDIIDSGFPLFGRSPTPKTSQRRITVEGVGDPVEIGDITVEPDDLIVADATGVVVVPNDAIEDVAETAEEILSQELLLDEKIANGATVPDLQSDGHSF